VAIKSCTIVVYFKAGGDTKVQFTGEYSIDCDGTQLDFESSKYDEPGYYFNFAEVLYYTVKDN
jgi:hypothetical protein